MAIISASVLSTPAFATPASVINKEWRLEQIDGFSGKTVLLLSPRAAKITNLTKGYEIISKYPDWDICAFRRDDKVLCRVNRREFFKQREYVSRKGRDLPSSFHFISQQTVGCLKAKVYRGVGDEIWIGKIPELPVEVEDLLVAHFKMSRIDGIPLRYSTTGADPILPTLTVAPGIVQTLIFDTKSCRLAPFNASEFVIPEGYRSARSDEIMTSVKKRNEATAIFSDIGLGENLGKRKSK